MCDSSQLVTSSHFMVRSVDRDNLWSDTPAKFRINLQKPLKPTLAKLDYAQIPATYYNITTNNNFIQINMGSALAIPINYSIPPGAYTLNDLIGVLQNDLTGLINPGFSVTFSQISGRISISNDSAFTLHLENSNSPSIVLGMEPLVYDSVFSVDGTHVPKIYDSAIYITTNFGTAIQTTTNKLHNVSFVIPHNCNRGEIIQFYSATQFDLLPLVKDQTIGYLEITLFDEYGNILQNAGEWQMMLRIK